MRKPLLAEPTRQAGRFNRDFERRVEAVAEEVRRRGHLPAGDEPHADWVLKRQREYWRCPDVRQSRRALHVAATIPGWQWATAYSEAWSRRYSELQALSHSLGSSALPRGAIDEALYTWLVMQRRLGREGRLPGDRYALLEALPGWTWRPSRTVRRSFLEREVGWFLASNLALPVSYGPTLLSTGVRVDLDVALPTVRIAVEIDGRWWHASSEDRDRAKNATLERAGWSVIRVRESPLAALTDLDVVVDSDPTPARVIDALLARLSELGVQPAEAATPDGRVHVDRRTDFHSPWERMLSSLDEYVAIYGHARVPIAFGQNGDRLGQWVAVQRREHRRGRLSTERRRRLDAVHGWAWNLMDATRVGWEAAYERTASHARRHGVPPAVKMRSDDGFHLGRWASYQRGEFRAGRLSPERARRLEQIPGWWWQDGA